MFLTGFRFSLAACRLGKFFFITALILMADIATAAEETSDERIDRALKAFSSGQRNDQNIPFSPMRAWRNMELKCRTGKTLSEDTCRTEIKCCRGNQAMHFPEHAVNTIMRRFPALAVLLCS